MLGLIDAYLFNSQLAKEVYEANHIIPKNSVIVSISNSSISQHNISVNPHEKTVVAYIGPDEEYKGYFDFLNIVDDLDPEKYDIKTYGHFPNEDCPSYIQQNGYFTKETIDRIYADIDVLIVPSKWKETFGFITMEALSYGVNVFVSENVGSKDLVSQNHIFYDKQDLLDKLNSVQRETVKLKTLKDHVIEVIEYYSRVRM